MVGDAFGGGGVVKDHAELDVLAMGPFGEVGAGGERLAAVDDGRKKTAAGI